MDSNDLDRRFAFHPATDDLTKDSHEQVRAACRTAASELDRLVPEGREKSLAVTNLEQAMMWANAGIARIGLTAGDAPPQAG